jgi:hypothetical protein
MFIESVQKLKAEDVGFKPYFSRWIVPIFIGLVLLIGSLTIYHSNGGKYFQYEDVNTTADEIGPDGKPILEDDGKTVKQKIIREGTYKMVLPPLVEKTLPHAKPLSFGLIGVLVLLALGVATFPRKFYSKVSSDDGNTLDVKKLRFWSEATRGVLDTKTGIFEKAGKTVGIEWSVSREFFENGPGEIISILVSPESGTFHLTYIEGLTIGSGKILEALKSHENKIMQMFNLYNHLDLQFSSLAEMLRWALDPEKKVASPAYSKQSAQKAIIGNRNYQLKVIYPKSSRFDRNEDRLIGKGVAQSGLNPDLKIKVKERSARELMNEGGIFGNGTISTDFPEEFKDLLYSNMRSDLVVKKLRHKVIKGSYVKSSMRNFLNKFRKGKFEKVKALTTEMYKVEVTHELPANFDPSLYLGQDMISTHDDFTTWLLTTLEGRTFRRETKKPKDQKGEEDTSNNVLSLPKEESNNGKYTLRQLGMEQTKQLKTA